MESLASESTRLVVSQQTSIDFNTHYSPSRFLIFNSRKRPRNAGKIVSLSLRSGRCGGSLSLSSGFFEVKRKTDHWRGVFCGCRNLDGYGNNNEGDLALTTDILEFITTSVKPKILEFMDAGRMVLVRALVREGGWLAYGWDLDEEKDDDKKFQESGFDVEDSHLKVIDKEFDYGAVQRTNSASSSGRSLETATNDDSGIEGILSRLRSQRNVTFGFDLGEKRSNSYVKSNGGKDDWLNGFSMDATAACLQGSRRPTSLSSSREIIDNSGVKLTHHRSLSGMEDLRNSHKSDMPIHGVIQRTGSSDVEFEAAEDETGYQSIRASYEDINQLHSRLQHLKLELSSVLHSLRSFSIEVPLQKRNKNSWDKYQRLSDAWEFQENEIIYAQDKLRSTRANLAVLQGRMSTAIMDAKRMVEEKQRRIDSARTASQLLCTACIIWTSSASEVLLAGSYDGWSSQRKMKKTNHGIFSLTLLMYPGRYEIKFIVDGQWKIDPLRPVSHHSGHENNLLLIG